MHDILIRQGQIYDGEGTAAFIGDIAIDGDRITDVGRLAGARGRLEIDADGLAVAPGFINMLSWANESLIEDGRSQSEIRQGVTLEVMGEGVSMGPLSEPMREEMRQRQGDIQYDIPWTTLGGYLDFLEQKGVATNVASFVGATTVRIHQLGREDRPPTSDELVEMQRLVAQSMADGAMGVSSALIYTPATFAGSDELQALALVAARYGGMYISHIRNEGATLLKALDELIDVARTTGVRAEVYHLKASGRANWSKIDEAIAKINAARAEGLQISADMYTYHASGTGLDASMPPWVQEGGEEAWIARLQNPALRARVIQEIRDPSPDWDNTYLSAGSPERVILAGFKSEALKPLTGKTLAEVAAMRGQSPEETIVDLVVEDRHNVDAIYFTMSEDNIRKKIAQPWMSFCSDGASQAAEGVFLQSSTHPRAYGSFARLLGKYVRDEQIIPLAEAIRRLTSLPAQNLKLQRRGLLQPGYFADVVLFDPTRIQDHATFSQPHQYATGVEHVFVNGVRVLAHGEHTGALPGRVVRGPGWNHTH